MRLFFLSSVVVLAFCAIDLVDAAAQPINDRFMPTGLKQLIAIGDVMKARLYDFDALFDSTQEGFEVEKRFITIYMLTLENLFSFSIDQQYEIVRETQFGLGYLDQAGTVVSELFRLKERFQSKAAMFLCTLNATLDSNAVKNANTLTKFVTLDSDMRMLINDMTLIQTRLLCNAIFEAGQ